MATYYVDENGNVTKKGESKKKKKKKSATYTVELDGTITRHRDDDIAPVKSTVEPEERTWFQKGAYEDGYQFGDFSKTLYGSTRDLKQNLWEGVLGIGEKVVDAGAYVAGGVGKLVGADGFADRMETFIRQDLINEEKVAKFLIGDLSDIAPTASFNVEKNSVFGEKSDSLVQSAGQLGATVGLQAVGVPWYLTTGATSFGGETESAFKQDATYGEAGLSAAITAGAEILTEKISGGIKFGGKALDDGLTRELARRVSNQTVRTLTKLGMDMAGEGSEEVLSGVMSAIGQKLTYADEKEFNELFSSEDALESFIGGAVLGGGVTGINIGKNAIEGKGRDIASGLTDTESKVVDRVYNDRVAEQEKNGKITEKAKRKIYDEVLSDMERGGIDIDTIEEVLGGETYTNYKKLVDAEDKMQREYDELGKKEKYTLADDARYKELADRLKYVREKGAKNELKKRLDSDVASMVRDSRLSESFAERSRRGQAFEADLTQYNEKQRAIVQKAAESGILNNTRRTHDFVDMVARIGAEKGITFDFANNAKLKESGFAVEGRTINGFQSKDGITVNIQSAKALDTVVGHEITHVLEGTELYTELRTAAIEYAKAKGDYQGRYDALVKMYESVEGADIDGELTADIVGEYLFTDSDFINNLSANHRNVFQKIYDEIKYLLKVATAGSKEARELEKVKRAFEKAYREGGKNKTAEDGGTQYSLEQVDGVDYVKAEKNLFVKEDGTPASEREVFKSLVGKTIHLPEGDVEIVNRLPGKSMYDELAKRYPKKLDGVANAKQLNSDVNRNMEELLDNSVATDTNVPDVGNRHAKQGIVSFDTRTVKFYDGAKAYDVEFSIATLTDGRKVAYAKKYFGYDADLTKKIQAAEARGEQSPLNQRPVSDGTVPQNGADVKYSLVEDQGTIDFLENQKHLTVYKAMALVDGKLYPPMASQTYVEEEYTTKSGEKKTRRVRKLKNPSVLGRWQQAEERTDIAEKSYDPKKGYSSFDLLKSNGKTTGGVAYNPYEHTSNIVLNDQFSEAYQRPELVTVEYEIPVSELTSGYKAQYAKDPVGLTDWKAGGVAQKLKHGHRDVYLTRWSKPVRVLSDAEVAQKYKEILDKEDGISVPWNVVTPSLREELEKIGVPIDYSDIKAGSTVRSFEAAMRGDYEKPKKKGKAAKYSLNEVTEDGLTMTYVRVPNQNTQNYGSTYGQNIEPAGEYMSMDTMQGSHKIDGYEYGTIQFKKPLVLEHINTGETGWKKTVSDMYGGLTGKKLSAALIKDGYDAIVTYDEYGYNEIVNLKGKKLDNPQSGAKFSLSEEIEPTDRLVAVHNKSVRGLQRMLDRGGVAFASIAIKKAGASHEGFGDVSIVFPRSTIDPEGNRWNKLYSNDAWTPTEPHTEYDVGDTYKYKKLFENMLGSDIYGALRGASYLDSDALERELGSSNGDVFEAVKRLGVVKYGYLQSIGQRPEMTTKQKTLDGFGRYKNDQLMAVFEALDGETIRNATYDSEDVLQRIADTLNEQFMQQLPNDDSVFKSFKKKPLYTADKINIVAIQDAYETWEAAGRTIPSEPDTYALENALRDNRELEEDEGYRRWVEDTFDGLIKDSGIPNGRDYYTASGNRRSFKQLHVPATLENIVQQMRKENETGIGSLGSINLRGAATKTYATVEEMRADSHKLLGTHIDDDVYDGYMDGFHARLNELKMKAAKGDSWSSRDTAEQVLLEAVRDAKAKASMASKLRKEAQWINYEPALVDELWQLKQDVQNMPAPYFEAKPRRIITPDEAAAYIVPDNAPASLFAALEERGLKYVTYKAGDEADRLAKLNSVLDEQPDLRFSLSAEGAQPTADGNYGRYHVYGRDIALEAEEDIAPMAAPVEDIAPVRTEAAAYEEPVQEESPYAELDRLTEEAEELERQMYEAMDAGDNEKAMEINADLVDAAVRITELEQQLDADVQDRLASIEDADAPVVREAPYSESTDTVTLPRKTVQSITKEAREALGFSTRRSAEMRELIEKFSQGEIDSERLYDEIADRFGTYTETGRNEDAAEVKKWLRTTPIHVSDEVKSNFADYTSSVMRPNFGKVRFSQNGLEVDMYYAELADKFPGFFPSDIITAGDQLQRIVDVANMDINTEQTHELDGKTLDAVTDTIVRRVNEYRQEQRQMLSDQNSRAAFNSLMADADRYAPVLEEDIAPVRADVASAAEPVAESAPAEAAVQQIKTVKERLAAKLQNLQTELAENQRLREESRTDYDLEILQAQTEYNALQNKNTMKANNLLRRIERLRRISGNTDADYAKRISDLEAQVAKTSEEARTGESQEAQGAMRKELHARKIEEMRFEFAERGYDFDEVLKKAKDLSTLATVDNTPQRVMEKALGYKEGQILADLTVNRVAQNETEGIRWLQSFTDRKTGLLAQISKQYGIKPGSKESAAAQMYAEGFYVADNDDIIEYGDRELAMDFPDAKVQANIKGLARDPRIRQIYDDTLAAINASRARNAYPEIQKLDNYFLHFRAMDDTFSRLGIPFNPNDIKAKDLPTDLNGVTADLKPGQPYFASAMHRRGKRTSFDLLGGLEQYLTSAKGQIYHIDDIQTHRALRNYIADTFGQAKGLEGLDTMTEEEAQEHIEEVYDGHLSTFAKFLNEEANVIAGKTALIDRGLEGIIGRRGMTFMDTLNRQVGANMVGFNVSSSLTNFIAPVQAFAKTNKAAFVKGFAQTVASRIGSITGKTDSFVENNPTIIRRKGADRFYRTPWQKVSDAGYLMMGAVDSISTEIIVRAKYNELVSKGMSEEQAVIEADKWTSRLMGDRSLGQQPQLFNSKTLGIITKFQLEVRNQLDSQFYDTIQEAKVSNEDIQNATERNAKTAAKVASVFVQLAVAQHLFGKAFESIAGYNPAFDIIEAIIKAFGWDDEEDSEDTALDNLEQGFKSLLEDMPYSSVATGGRIPISAALPIGQLYKGEDQYGNEKSRWETLGEAAPYWLLPGGYGQIKKTKQGLGMFDEDLPIAGSYTDSGNLRFTVEDNLASRAQAAVFGQWASSGAREYFDNEYAPLKENQIQEMIDADLPISEYRDYREGLKGKDTLGEKVAYIADLDLPISTKNLLVNNIADREDPIDMTGFHEYADWGEFEYAHKYPEKYDFLQSVGVSVVEYQSFDDDTKEAYNWAYQNPEKFTLSKSVTSDVAVYRQYTKALNNIKADKDEEGKSISGSRKAKVIDYLNEMDADYYAKLILFKMEYPSDDTYNREIIEYLNGRNDISFEEEVTILKELGFTVTADGTVRW